MKKYIITLCFCICALTPRESRAEVDPRVMALGSIAAYGTIGGGLLGTATLAFGGETRNIFKGMSLGLYAGLIFGTFVVVTHYMKNKKYTSPIEPQQDNYYPEAESPYESGYEGGAYEDTEGEGAGYYWQKLSLESLNVDRNYKRILSPKKNEHIFNVPVFVYTF